MISKVLDIEHSAVHIFQEEEIYWPDENTSVTLGHTAVTHKGTEVKDATTILKLEIIRFGQVAEYRECFYNNGWFTYIPCMCQDVQSR